MTNKENFYFIGKCLGLKFGGNPRAICEIMESGEVDWGNFAYTASNHLVLATLYVIFRDNNLLAYLPHELLVEMEKLYHFNCERNIAIKNEAIEIVNLFKSENISPIFLKGTGNLLDNLYDDIGERIIGDIDLLVSREELLKAAELLKKVGYYTEAAYMKYLTYDMVVHYPRLLHKQKYADVEVHAIPVKHQYAKYFNYNFVFQDRKNNEESGIYVLSDDHKAIINFIHAQLSDKAHAMGQLNFRNGYDLMLINNRVSANDCLNDFGKYKSKFYAYGGAVRYAFLGDKGGSSYSLTRKFYQYKIDLALSSRLYSIYYSKLMSIYFFILDRYWFAIKMSIKHHSFTRTILSRLFNLGWYGAHLRELRQSFK